MASAAISALRADRDELLDLAGHLTDADWKSESGCPGWSVQDVVTHLGTLYWLVVDPTVLPDTGGAPTEEAQERAVESRRAWSSESVVEDYAAVSAQALDLMAELETQDFELPLGDLGTYHASKLVNAFAFDHYTHIRADLFRPRGPLEGPAPASDALRLAPALDWIEVAAPQQNAALLAEIPGAIEIEVFGAVTRADQDRYRRRRGSRAMRCPRPRAVGHPAGEPGGRCAGDRSGRCGRGNESPARVLTAADPTRSEYHRLAPGLPAPWSS